ncbi:3'-5' exonuclease [Dasania marina]|uniref:3'-5' exonuclease n=1 Tax=Dasania marina TaxID=471499 RepID=UPI0030DAE9B8|tara:strand:- start:10057 stop:10671 length:615 start_codon:yes stop_codon:yes gene_type:complete
MSCNANDIVVLDFETTGLSPLQGDRAIEIGAVRIVDGVAVDRFQSLMNPGFKVSGFISQYTGISNTMLRQAPPCEEVMDGFADFIADSNLLAHNASFDKRFLDAELAHIQRRYRGEFSCSLLVSRRIYPAAPNHQLATLLKYANITADGDFHRALYDSEMTAKLWLALLQTIGERCGLQQVPFSLVKKLVKVPKKSVADFLAQW